MITGKLCKKMIHADMPYEIIKKAIQLDSEKDIEYIERFTIQLEKLKKAHDKLIPSRIEIFMSRFKGSQIYPNESADQ